MERNVLGWRRRLGTDLNVTFRISEMQTFIRNIIWTENKHQQTVRNKADPQLIIFRDKRAAAAIIRLTLIQSQQEKLSLTSGSSGRRHGCVINAKHAGTLENTSQTWIRTTFRGGGRRRCCTCWVAPPLRDRLWSRPKVFVSNNHETQLLPVSVSHLSKRGKRRREGWAEVRLKGNRKHGTLFTPFTRHIGTRQ